MIKTLKLGTGGNCLNLIKGIYKKYVANIILNDERLNNFFLIRNKATISILITAIQDCTRGSKQAIRQENKIKASRFFFLKKRSKTIAICSGHGLIY